MHLVVPGETESVERLDAWSTIHHVLAAPSPWFDRRYRLLRPDHYWSRRAPIGRILADARPDVVEVCDKYTLAPVGRLLRAGWYWPDHRPTVVGLSCERLDDNVAAYLGGGRRLRRAALGYLRHVYAPSFDAHIANSEYTAAELRAAAIDVVDVCEMGVDADLFARTPRDLALRTLLLHAANGTSESVLVLYAGRLSPEKHLDVLVQAIGAVARTALAPDLRLVLAGHGPQTAALEAMAARVAPGRVHFAGHVADRQRLAAIYASADVFAHPNHREPFGIGPLEAMAAGVPVVVPNQGGVLAYANSGNAWLADPDAASFAAALLAAAWGRQTDRLNRARETAQAYAWPVMAERYLQTLDRIHARRLAGATAASARPLPAPQA